MSGVSLLGIPLDYVVVLLRNLRMQYYCYCCLGCIVEFYDFLLRNLCNIFVLFVNES